MSAQVIEPFGGGGCAFAPQDFRNEDDEERDFEEQIDEALEQWQADFCMEKGRMPTPTEYAAQYKRLRNPPQKRVFPEVHWSDDGECPF